MMDILDRISTALDRWRAYRRTVRALEAMPLDVALDLDIHRGDARLIARRAVYGL